MAYKKLAIVSLLLGFASTDVYTKDASRSTQYEQIITAIGVQKQAENQLFVAITTADAKKLEQLIKVEKVNINAVNEVGYTPFLWACVIGSESMALQCINLGADVNCVDQNGCSALMWAIEKKLDKVVKNLIFTSHVQVNVANHAGMTPLMFAAQQNNATVVSWLLAAGAEQFVKDKKQKAVYTYMSFYLLTKLRLLELAQMKVRHRIHITNPELSCLEKVAGISHEWQKLYALAVTKSTWQTYTKSLAHGSNEE